MISRFSALFVLILSATSVVSKPGPGLSLEVSGEERINGIQNFHVKTTVTNTGDWTLKVLNDPRGPLSKTPSHTFTIKNVNGTEAVFTGAHIKYVHQSVSAKANPRSFTVLEPGQSISVDHKLAGVYNFTNGGEGIYFVEAHNLFHYLNATTNVSVPIFADTAPFKTILTGQLAASRPHLSNSSKREQFKGCSSKQQAQIKDAATHAKSYSQAALAYLQATNTSSDRFTEWFGKFTEKRHGKVLKQFTKLANNDFSSMNFDCSTCDEDDSYAYVYPDEFGNVFLCDAFWDAPLNGTDSKGGTLLHETSHFDKIASTEDIAYGQSDCKKLAKHSPKEAIENADSHEYFAENHPAKK